MKRIAAALLLLLAPLAALGQQIGNNPTAAYPFTGNERILAQSPCPDQNPCSGAQYTATNITMEQIAEWVMGGGGSGTVTSVAAADGSTLPIFGITGSPITTAGTLTFTLANQQPNLVFAGPASGSTHLQPNFRALVNADLPSLLTASTSGNAATATALASAPTQCSTGNAPIGIDVHGNAVGCAPISGSGVSSVGLTAPSVFTVTNSPITSSGNLGLAFATGQTANEFLATPNGSAGAVALRALVGADLPASGVSAGSCTLCDLTIDATGRITAQSSGSGSSTVFQVNSTGLISSSTVNFESASANNGVTIGFTNPSAGIVQLTRTGTLTVAGGGTGQATLAGFNVLIGNGTGGIATAAPSSTVGEPLISQGTGANPAFGALPLGTSGVVSGLLPVASGGTGTSTPGLVAGTNITITGTWPNQTVASSGGGGGCTETSGSFTATLSGMTTTVTGTVNYRIFCGDMVMLSAGQILGTSNSGSMNMSGAPMAIQPAAAVHCVIEAYNGAVILAELVPTNSSTWTMNPWSTNSSGSGATLGTTTTVWNSSGNKGFTTLNCTYPLF